MFWSCSTTKILISTYNSGVTVVTFPSHTLRSEAKSQVPNICNTAGLHGRWYENECHPTWKVAKKIEVVIKLLNMFYRIALAPRSQMVLFPYRLICVKVKSLWSIRERLFDAVMYFLVDRCERPPIESRTASNVFWGSFSSFTSWWLLFTTWCIFSKLLTHVLMSWQNKTPCPKL